MGPLNVLLLRTVAWFVALIPRRLRFYLGGGLGWGLRKLGLRAGVVSQNLEYAFPGPQFVERRAEVFKESYRHLGRLSLEILLLFGPLRRFARTHVEILGREHLRRAIQAGQGAILLSSHVGNWEMMAASSGQIPDLELMLVTKHLKPEWLHRGIEEARLRCGVRATYEPKTLRDVLRHLKRGQVVGFVLDQYAGAPVGMRVPVFGIPVGTTTAVAMLARRTGAAVLPVVNYRLSDGRYRAEIRPPLGWVASPNGDATEELGMNTALYAKTLEADILNHPEQWLWTHRRFKGDLTPLREGEWKAGRARR